MTSALRLERSGPGDVVARVVLARPDVHNAFDASLIAELRTAFAALAREDPTSLRAVVLAGDGPSFCAGADIDWMRAAMRPRCRGQRAGRDGHGRHVREPRHLPRAGHRPRPRARPSAAGSACAPSPTWSWPRAAPGSASPRPGWASCRRSSPRSSSPRSASRTPGRCSPAGDASMPSGPSGSASSTRSSRATRRWTRRSRRTIADVLASGPTAARAAKAIVREVRGLGHGSAKWHTARVIARQRVSAEAREGFAAFDEHRPPAWVPADDA